MEGENIMKKFTLFIIFCAGIIFYTNINLNAKSEEVPNNYKCTYEQDINSSKSIEEIITDIGLTASDEYDGDLSDAITYEDSDSYEANAYTPETISDRQLGTYKVIFKVKDTSNNSATMTMYINVVDTVKPYFLDTGIYRYDLDIDNYQLTNQDIINNVKAKDDFDGDNVIINIVSGSTESLEKVINTEQIIVVRVCDTSGNFVEKNIVVVFHDYTKPVIEVDDLVASPSYDSALTIEEILSSFNIHVTDNYDTGLTYNIVSDDFTPNRTKLGLYDVVIQAADSSGNVGELLFQVNVIDRKAPVFALNKDKISVYTTTKNKLNNKDLLGLLKQSNRIKNDQYEVYTLNNTYSENATPGEYNYVLRVDYGNNQVEDYEFNIHVVEEVVKDNLTFFEKVLLILKKIGLILLSILRWPIDKMKKLF